MLLIAIVGVAKHTVVISVGVTKHAVVIIVGALLVAKQAIVAVRLVVGVSEKASALVVIVVWVGGSAENRGVLVGGIVDGIVKLTKESSPLVLIILPTIVIRIVTLPKQPSSIVVLVIPIVTEILHIQLCGLAGIKNWLCSKGVGAAK